MVLKRNKDIEYCFMQKLILYLFQEIKFQQSYLFMLIQIFKLYFYNFLECIDRTGGIGVRRHLIWCVL